MIHLKGRIRTYTVILVLSVLGYFGRLMMFNEMSHAFNIRLLAFSFFVLIAVWEFFSLVDRQLKKQFPIDEAPLQRVILQLSISSLFLFGIRGLGIYWLADYFPIEFNWAFRAAIYVVDFFVAASINSLFFIAEYIEKWKLSIQRAERLEREKTQVQFDNLKNQLNPHFLFNALTSLNSLIKSNPELASDFLQNMSRVYRYVLKHKDKEVVSLREETEFLNDYLFLLETRFGEAFRFESTIPEEALGKGIVPVTLQILVENAVKHNIISDKKPLHLCLSVEGDYLVMKNANHPKKNVEGSNGLGLENLKNLYRYMSDLTLYWELNEREYKIHIPLIER